MNPIILIGGAAALLLLSGKKKSAATESSDAGTGEVPDDSGSTPDPDGGDPSIRWTSPGGILGSQQDVTGEPWESCPGPAGTVSAYGTNGECMVFWKTGETEGVVINLVQSELDKLSNSKIKSVCEPQILKINQFTDTEEWGPNYDHVDFVGKIIKKLWSQLGSVDFRKLADNEYLGTAPQDSLETKYFPKVVYGRVSDIVVPVACDTAPKPQGEAN